MRLAILKRDLMHVERAGDYATPGMRAMGLLPSVRKTTSLWHRRALLLIGVAMLAGARRQTEDTIDR